MKTKMDIENFRRCQLAIAEMIDAWRLIPRVMVIMYMGLIYMVVEWYTLLEDRLIPGCIPTEMISCISQAPSNQHAALVTAVIGFSAAIFGFYASTGKVRKVPPKPKKEESIIFENKPTDDNY